MIEVFYFFYFQAVAINMAFMPAYLRGLGLSGREISTVFAISPLLALAVPLAWATLADRTRRHDRVLRMVVGGACLGFVPLLFARSFGPILIGWITYAVFSVSVGGLADALAVARVRAGAIYGRLRLWGSVGFVVAAVAFGRVLWARHGSREAGADWLVPVAMWLALVAAFIAALPLRGTGEGSARPRAADVRALVAEPRLLLLLLAAALHWICLTPYNVYWASSCATSGCRRRRGAWPTRSAPSPKWSCWRCSGGSRRGSAWTCCWRSRSAPARCAGWRSRRSTRRGR